MPDTEISLEDNEDILRVFFRSPDEPWGFGKLRRADFGRKMFKHSGVSMLRLKYLKNRQEALDWVDSKKLKGLAACKAKKLKDLGLRFMASSVEAKHISLRCSPCDLSVDYPTLCKPAHGAECLINLRSEGSLSQALYKAFAVDTPVAPAN